jgi:hypothetical protein
MSSLSRNPSEALSSLVEQAHITAPTEKSDDITKSEHIVYRPLNSELKEIRLLEVAPGTADDIVSGTLKHVSLVDDPKPAYETISYCWGPARDHVFIMLDGRMVTVPPSSEAAVRRMRLSDKPRVLWIDAICIDQSLESERSEQVAFMGMVYSSGKRNLIYLGEDTEGMANTALKSMKALVDAISAANNDFETLSVTVIDLETGEWRYCNDDFGIEINWEVLGVIYDFP